MLFPRILILSFGVVCLVGCRELPEEPKKDGSVTEDASTSCTVLVSPTKQTIDYRGGAGEVEVKAEPDCSWTAVAKAGWISVTEGSGNGPGKVQFRVEPNTGDLRSTSILVNGQTAVIEQAAEGQCSYALSQTSATFGSSAQTLTVSVMAPGGCQWKALSATSWIKISKGGAGTGDGDVVFSVAANDTSAKREGGLVIADILFEVTQAGAGCSYEVTPTSETFDAAAASAQVTVTTGDGCPWEAKSNDGWLTVTSEATGSGSGTVNYSVNAQDSSLERVGSLTIAGQTVKVRQSGAGCSYAIDPENSSYDASAGTGTLTVTATEGCSWTAQSSDGWITITSGASGDGDGTVEYAVAANGDSTVRSGEITVADKSFEISQAGVACSDAISPTSASASAAAATGSVAVTAPAGCDWTATTNDDWITITTGATGSGGGSVSYSAEANQSSVTREGEILIAGSVFVLTQAGVSCSFAIDPASAAVDAAASSVAVNVSAATGCAWTAVSGQSWINVTDGTSGSGNGTVSLAVSANSGSDARSGTVTIAGESFTVSQAGVACSYQLSSSSAIYTSAGGSGTVGVTAPNGCTWTASSNEAWVSVTGGASGSGDGMVSYTVQTNNNSAQRSATLTVAGKSFTVTQSGATCSYQISSNSATYDSTGGSGTVGVTTIDGCTWTASSNQAWVSVTGSGSGSGDGTVSYTVQTNNNSSQRSATLTVAGKSFTVTQSGATCSYQLSSTSVTYDSAGGAGTVGVTAVDGCTWTASSNQAWVSVMSGASGTGNGTVSYTVQANSTAERSATLTIAAKSFTITQSSVCGVGETLCNTECVNLMTDSDHCGACNRGCNGQACSAGKCSCGVPTGYPAAGNPVTTPHNGIHSALNSWQSTQIVCQDIQCVDGSWVGLEEPSNFDTNENVFGPSGCCATDGCCVFMGADNWPCCSGGKTACGSTCVDLTNSADNCGACGRSCPIGVNCINGKCGCVPMKDASGATIFPYFGVHGDSHTSLFSWLNNQITCWDVECVDGEWVGQGASDSQPDPGLGCCPSSCCDHMGANDPC